MLQQPIRHCRIRIVPCVAEQWCVGRYFLSDVNVILRAVLYGSILLGSPVSGMSGSEASCRTLRLDVGVVDTILYRSCCRRRALRSVIWMRRSKSVSPVASLGLRMQGNGFEIIAESWVRIHFQQSCRLMRMKALDTHLYLEPLRWKQINGQGRVIHPTSGIVLTVSLGQWVCVHVQVSIRPRCSDGGLWYVDTKSREAP
jgi:hypothetical protein